MHAPLPAILLAAGFSRRMGECKLLLPFRGKALLEHVLLALAASPGLSPITVVLGPHSPPQLLLLLKKYQSIAHTLVAAESALGQAESLKAGWRQVLGQGKTPGAMVLLGDQPLLAPDLLAALAADFAEHGSCVAPVFEGRRGNPVILTADALNTLLTSPERESPRLALAAQVWRLLEWANGACLRDVDTPEEYAALAALNEGCS